MPERLALGINLAFAPSALIRASPEFRQHTVIAKLLNASSDILFDNIVSYYYTTVKYHRIKITPAAIAAGVKL